MISRLRLATRIGGAARLLAHARPSIPATTRLMCQVPQKEETPEFGQFFRDISGLLKDKTGETGHKLLAAGLLTYVLSKEILIIHDETLLGAVMFATVYAIYRKVSQPVADYLDARSQEILDLFNEGRNREIDALKKGIEEDKKIEYMLTTRTDIVEIMRENNAMALELEYRNRLHEVAREVKKRMDYQSEIEIFKRKVEQEHMVDWMEREVVKSISPQLEKDSVSQCIKDLKDLKAMAVA
ncbi:ATP synthase F(0) complex subunit B1, mitochondrial [Desmophyllum pertusum]|uniref:ATP synthase subunit b n=1 Tax=Desmophyllum pertusum TaxID=174260 RepID=A0A9X0CYN7_9CNID|nr:ATP synthase F(0) complex subunit B1, mitochondrial [Desmophyllum pertusum]